MATVRPTEETGPEASDPATFGFMLAGIALAAAFLPWTNQPQLVELSQSLSVTVGSITAAGLAATAVVAFGLRRYGVLDRVIGSAAAGLLCLGVAAIAIYRLYQPAIYGSTPKIGIGLPIAAVATISGVGVAVADWLALTDDQFRARLKGFSIATGTAFLSLIVTFIIAGVPVFVARARYGMNIARIVEVIGAGVGMVVFTYAALRFRDLSTSYLDFEVPDLTDIGYSIAGLFVIFVALAGVSYIIQSIGIPNTTSGIEKQARSMENPYFLLAFIPLSWFAIALGEELVFRNIIQKYLYEMFSRPAAVLMASLAFGSVHILQYAASSPLQTLTSIFVVFVLSLVLGWTYYKTENLIVPIFIHGALNAIQFLFLYLDITGMV